MGKIILILSLLFEYIIKFVLTSNIKVSIIIPVYNTEPYLDRCIQSALNQTLKEIEVICIDDASTDNSIKILEKYEKIDHRFKYIHFSKNKGVSVARNAGMEMALGEFIGFMDSDDYVNSKFFENLYEKSKEYEIVIGNFLVGTNLSRHNLEPQVKELYGYVWDSIWRKSFLNEHQIKFPIDVRTQEDEVFRKVCYDLNPRINKTPDNGIYYYYKRREGSALNLSNKYLKKLNKKAKRKRFKNNKIFI